MNGILNLEIDAYSINHEIFSNVPGEENGTLERDNQYWELGKLIKVGLFGANRNVMDYCIDNVGDVLKSLGDSSEWRFFELCDCIFNIGGNPLTIDDGAGDKISEVLGSEGADENSFDNLSNFLVREFGLDTV